MIHDYWKLEINEIHQYLKNPAFSHDRKERILSKIRRAIELIHEHTPGLRYNELANTLESNIALIEAENNWGLIIQLVNQVAYIIRKYFEEL